MLNVFVREIILDTFNLNNKDFPDCDPTTASQYHGARSPSHTDIEGNEKADKLAKEATSLARNGPIASFRQAKFVMALTWNNGRKTPEMEAFPITDA